jgi:carboxypeptidase C (cathepsin A)
MNSIAAVRNPSPPTNCAGMRAQMSGLLLCATLILGGAAPASSPASPGDPVGDVRTVSSLSTSHGAQLSYQAVAGTLAVKSHADPADPAPADPAQANPAQANPAQAGATASMSFVAYSALPLSPSRPIVFLFNGGPGSSSVWLHMGAFGPKHVVTGAPTQLLRPPYRLAQNPNSLLDVADLVFIDAPGTGFGRIDGKDGKKLFFGVDADVAAFADFIDKFLQKFDRRQSPLFLFGESYGTSRAAILADELEENRRITVSGVILMSQSLNFDLVVDHASGNPGSDLPYVLGLPSYTATAFYHHKLPNPGKATLPDLLAAVQTWATNVYLPALAQGADLDPTQRAAVTAKLHDYTGLSSDYIGRADLRIEAGEFLQQLGSPSGEVYGRLDTRYEGPPMDPLEKEASYDPQTARIAAAYAAGWDNYARNDLKLNSPAKFIQQVGDAWSVWNWKHVQPNVNEPVPGALNTMADLAAAMTFNPGLKVMLNSGYFDVATPFFQGFYELKHLPMAADLQKNITMFRYPSGHKIFVDPASLEALHTNVAHFIEVAVAGGQP